MDSSFLSRAKHAIHNAAAKAERLLTEFKDDFKSDLGMSVDTGNAFQSAVAKAERMLQELKEDFGLSSSKKTGMDGSRRGTTTHAETNVEQQFQDNLQGCILKISKYDEVIENLRLRYVPEKMKEQEFWRYYFLAINLMKQEAYGSEVCEGNFNNPCICSSQVVVIPKMDPNEVVGYKMPVSAVAVPSSKILRRLAAVSEIASSVAKIKDLSTLKRLEKDSSQSGGFVLGLTAVKNSLLRETKDSKSGISKEIMDCLRSLFETDVHQDINSGIWSQACTSKLSEDIRAVPLGTFVSRLAEIVGSLETGRMMSEFWYGLISELRRHWEEGQPVPRLPMDTRPDLRYCLLHQKLQVINSCIARQQRHAAHLASIDALCEGAEYMGLHPAQTMDRSTQSVLCFEGSLESSPLFVKGKEGQLLLRLGADNPAANLRMLETGEQVYCPVTQEGPLLTEDLIEETEELVLRTGSVGAGCSQLLSDMQSFKAANPGCILEDFVRWHSPLDWSEDSLTAPTSTDSKQESESRGFLSTRMQSKGNLWQELWASAKPIPAAKQAPLYDEDLAVEHVLNGLEEIPPAELFEQLFRAILSSGFCIAESTLSMKGSITIQFNECKNMIMAACKKGTILDDLEQLCQAYETMETMLMCPCGEPQGLSQPVSSSNVVTNEQSLLRSLINEHRASSLAAKPVNGFCNFPRLLEAKSLFDKRSSKFSSPMQEETTRGLQDGDWTLV